VNGDYMPPDPYPLHGTEMVLIGGPADGEIHIYTGGLMVECFTSTPGLFVHVYTFLEGPNGELALIHQPELTRAVGSLTHRPRRFFHHE
jgi:hypothetical protein